MPLPQPIGSITTGLGDLLATQVADETDEERRKRLAQMKQAQAGPAGLSSMMGMTRASGLASVYGGGY